ncbi:Protein FANTASTIC FOUR like [Quillaja saponaria]|uniref:Protein FANTASTIC FOUR like n=1 Tax=Quillaja saponaria TaxID=32244 RepID=A0AAD7Q5B9_QUISA|nr:Protein FANTASTIC FOUR like [Quillaja saponaria]
MASSQNSFSSLKDVLKRYSSSISNMIPFPKKFTSSPSSSIYSINVDGLGSIIGENFEMLSLEESSFESVSLPPASPLSSPVSTDFSLESEIESHDDHEVEIIKGYREIKKEGSDEIEKVPLRTFTGRVVPPPISSLKLIKTGKPYAYLEYDEDTETYVVDQVNIPNRDMLLARRENGRLNMYVVLPDCESASKKEK